MRKVVVVAPLALMAVVALGLWTEKRTHPKGTDPEPVAASSAQTLEYRFGPVRLRYTEALASALTGVTQPAARFIADEVPDGVGPEHVEIRFAGFPGTGPSARVEPLIDIYPVADFDKPEFGTAEQNLPLKELTLLREQLAEPAGEGKASEASSATAGFLPYMPVAADAGQVVAAKRVVLRGSGVEGIRYLTAYSQESVPLVEGQLFYTFQGLTRDHSHYVAASFPLQSGFLPDRLPEPFDFAAFETNFAAYQRETAAAIAARADDQFTPPLGLLDALMESILVDAR